MYARQHLKRASDRVKYRYKRLVTSVGYQKGNELWLRRPTRMKRKVAQATILMGGPIQSSHLVNDVVCIIQRNPKIKMIVVHLDRLVLYQETGRDNQP
jgi:hypothetical protein